MGDNTRDMADWFYGKDNTQHGPVSELEIRTLISSGQINGSTIIWREGMADWIPMKDVAEFQALVAPAGQVQAQPQAQAPATNPYTAPGAQQYGTIPTDTLSIVSLVCGIMAIITCYLWALFGIPAVICGHMSLKKINSSPTPVAGRGMAIAGLITGYIGIAMQLVMIVGIIIAIASSSSSSYSSP